MRSRNVIEMLSANSTWRRKSFQVRERNARALAFIRSFCDRIHLFDEREAMQKVSQVKQTM